MSIFDIGFKSFSMEMFYDVNDKSYGSYKVFLQKADNYQVEYLMLISGKGSVNPTQFPKNTFIGIKKLLHEIDLNLDDVEIYLDLLEYIGPKKDRIYRWQSRNNEFFDTLEQVEINENETLRLFIYSYYKDKWSTLIDSTLNNQEKINLIARVFAESYLDNYMIDDLTERFKKSLSKVKKDNQQLTNYLLNMH
ncbi:MAG: hypothetical protein WBK53_07500 [Halanaerobiales bacterium]